MLQGLMSGLGNSTALPTPKPGTKLQLNRVLISRPNGRLGNMLLTTPLVQEIQQHFPDCTIDFFVKGGLAPIVYRNYPHIGRVLVLPGKPFKELGAYFKIWFKLRQVSYDLVINVAPESSSGRLSTQFAKTQYRLFGQEQAPESWGADGLHMAKKPVYGLREFLQVFGITPTQEVAPIDLKLSDAELAHGREKLRELVGQDGPVICLFTFATGNKMLPESWWLPFYEGLRAQYPNHNILEILPKENISQIRFRAPHFLGGDVREMAAIIKACEVFIGADSGIMHLASAARAKTVGLFHVTSPVKYAPYGNGSAYLDVKQGDLQQWLAAVAAVMEK